MTDKDQYFFSNPPELRKQDKPAVTSNKLTNNFAVLITSGLEPDVARGQPTELRHFKG
jgi:hypothetical protein